MHPVGRGGRDASKRPTVPTARMLTELRKVRNPALNGTSGPRAAQRNEIMWMGKKIF